MKKTKISTHQKKLWQCGKPILKQNKILFCDSTPFLALTAQAFFTDAYKRPRPIGIRTPDEERI